MNASTTIRNLTAEIDDRKARRAVLDQQIETLERALNVLTATEATLPIVPRKSESSYAATITDAIEQVLLEERPLHRSEILARVSARGVYVGGTKPIASLGSYLSVDNRFKNVGRGVWTLTNDVLLPDEGVTKESTDESSISVPSERGIEVSVAGTDPIPGRDSNIIAREIGRDYIGKIL